MIKISASFDDGSAEDWEIARLMEKYKIDTVFYIPVNWQKYNLEKGNQPLTEDQVFDIADRFEIGSHGVNHELLTRVDEQIQIDEILGSRQYWRSRGITVNKFCYPRGYYNTDIKEIVKGSGYDMARTTRVAEISPAIDPFETHTTVHVGLDRKEYGSDWYTFAEKKLDEALSRVDEDIEYHFWGHGYEIKKNNEWYRFEKFLELLSERTHR